MKTIASLLLAIATCTAATAAPLSFDFKDPKGVNNATFKLDAPLEAISGSANGITGTITFDPANPAATQGRIVIATATLHVPNPTMKEHLHGEQWLNSAVNKEITFEARTLANVKTTDDNTSADVTGTLTLNGKTRDVTVPVKFAYLKDKLAARTNGAMKGDLLVVRASFAIKRSDYGINPKAPEDKVSNTIDLTLSIAGAAPAR